MALPWRRFTALLGAIPALQAEDDLRALNLLAATAYPGERGAAFREIRDGLLERAGIQPADTAPTATPGLPGVSAEREPGSIERERERQRLAAEQREAARRAAFAA